MHLEAAGFLSIDEASSNRDSNYSSIDAVPVTHSPSQYQMPVSDNETPPQPRENNKIKERKQTGYVKSRKRNNESGPDSSVKFQENSFSANSKQE